MRTSAKREAEQARAAADREVQEARRTLAVEKERLTREAAEHHSSATAETQKLVEEAEQRANAAEARGPRGRRRRDQPPQAVPRTRPTGCSATPAARPSRSSPPPRPRPRPSPPPARPRRSSELAVLKAEVDRYQKRRDAIVGAARRAARRDLGLRRRRPGKAEAGDHDRRERVPRCGPAGSPGRPPRRAHPHRRGPRRSEHGSTLQHPFRLGFFLAVGALLAWWLGGLAAVGRVDPDPDPGRGVPRRRAQPGRGVARPARARRAAGRCSW